MENNLPQQSIVQPVNQPITPPPITPAPKTFPKKIIILIGIVVILILIMLTTYLLINSQAKVDQQVSATTPFASSPTPAITPTNVIWQVKDNVLSATDIEFIKSQIIQKIKPESSDLDIVILDASISGTFGVISGKEQLKTPGGLKPTGSLTLLLNKNASGWEAISTQDNHFCEILKKLPDTIMNQNSKDYFMNCFR